MEEVHHLLTTAFTKTTHREVADTLMKVEKLIQSLQIKIDNTVLKLTRKLSSKFGFSIFSQLPKVYITYLKQVDKSNTELLINLCNDALLVKDSLNGTEISDQINTSVREILIILIQQGILDSQQSQVVQQLLEQKSTLNFEEELSYAIEELDNNSSVGMHMLIDLFSSLFSTKDQFYYYSTQISSVIKALQTKKSIEIYNLCIKFMDIFLLPTKYLIKIEENLAEYELSHLKLFKNYEDVFYTSLSMLKLLLKCDRYINENSVKLIFKL